MSSEPQPQHQQQVQQPQQEMQQPQMQQSQIHQPQPDVQSHQPPQQPQMQEAVVTSQPEKGSPPQVYPGGYPLPPYSHSYPGHPMPGYPTIPGTAPNMVPNMTAPNMVPQNVPPQMVQPVVNAPIMPSMQMPVQQQTVTNVNVNAGGTKLLRNWKANFCACCKDPIGCIGVLFCFECFLCWFSSRLDEGCYMPIFVPYALPALRLKFRTAQRIKGSICEDCLLMFCGCGFCVACQLKREYDMLGDPLNHKMLKIHAP